MSMRDRLLDLLLWYVVFAWGSWFGGTLYQMLVVVPMWSATPPGSVTDFFVGTRYNETIRNFFGPPFMIARVLPVCLALALAWHRPAHRRALAVAALCLVAAVVFTLNYMYPMMVVLFAQAGADLPGGEVARMVSTWIWADRARFVVGVVAFAAILTAFRLPLRPQQASPGVTRASSND